MGDGMPHDGRAHGIALAAWLVVAAAGTAAVWGLSKYVERLTLLGQTDPSAAAALFRTRVLPAVGGIALVSVIGGVAVARRGVIALRSARLPEDDGAGTDDEEPGRRGARVAGLVLLSAGALMAALSGTLFGAMACSIR